MFRSFRMLIVSFALIIIWNAPGRAFQLFGNAQNPQSLPVTSSENSTGTGTSSDPALDLGGNVGPGKDRMNIWIPGLGVVGKMPKLDFGLEMLYGGSDIAKDAPPAAHELNDFDAEFAIKGTIKRKF